MQNPFRHITLDAQQLTREDGRAADQARPLHFEVDFVPHAAGSVLVALGRTRVICAASLEKKVPAWMLHQGIGGGWLTAEYSMLPYSNSGERKPREITRGKPDGRSMEIQRFLGRALRAAICLKKMPSYTLWLDADVIQADGGTRTAALCGGYVAAHLAIQRAVNTGLFRDNPLQEAVGALSIGLCDAQPRVDLAYAEDVQAAADGHAVLTASGKIVELHLCGEQATFEQSQMDTLLELARRALVPVFEAQQAALAKALAAKPKL